MPELPEVETTRRGISAHVTGKKITTVRIHNPGLRWPVPAEELQQYLPGQAIRAVYRRAKYLLFDCGTGYLIIHLGMSGSLRVLDQDTALDKHEHVELLFDNGSSMRLRDPRRFGAVLWTSASLDAHPLLEKLGPEPLSDEFDAEYLFQQTRQRRCTIKSLIMDARTVVGVGNIYASEALFHAGIRPAKQAARLSRKACSALVNAIRQVLSDAIAAGGTTLRDFSDSEGRAGYFSLSLSVYGRAGDQCDVCGATIKRKQIAQRSSFYCPNCQK